MSETVREARARFLKTYHLGTETYTAPDFAIHLGRWTFKTPNPGLLPWHDLHHVATGFPSTLIGEAQISAYELRVGCGNPLIFLLCVGAIGIGLVLSPRRIITAWRVSRGTHGLYRSKLPYETLMDMTVEELRAHLQMPPQGLWPVKK